MGNAALGWEVPIARRLGKALGDLDHSGAAVAFPKAVMLDLVQPFAAEAVYPFSKSSGIFVVRGYCTTPVCPIR
jgi:hypothetical protein